MKIDLFICIFFLVKTLIVSSTKISGGWFCGTKSQYVNLDLLVKIVFFWFQDFEEQLDMKDRLIKRLQDQIKALQTHAEGKTLSVHLLSHLANPVSSSPCFVSSSANQKEAPAVPKEYLGMLEYKKEDESRLIRTLVLGKSITKSICVLV